MISTEFRVGPSRWVWRALAALTIVAIVTVGIYAVSKLSNVDCRSRIEARFFIGVADALNAPPAPNPARALAAQEILKAGEDMKNIASTCG